jgi:hypothetical protein
MRLVECMPRKVVALLEVKGDSDCDDFLLS